MKIDSTKFEGVYIITPQIWGDNRGYFFESFVSDKGEALGWKPFIQDNEAYSKKGILRGLHFQRGESAQAKLVRVVVGEVLDVAVDLRPQSATYGQHISVILNDINKKQMYVPRGFAHGYIVLSEEAIFSYKCDNYYNKDSEGGIKYDDPILGIDWILPQDIIEVSEKDIHLPKFQIDN